MMINDVTAKSSKASILAQRTAAETETFFLLTSHFFFNFSSFLKNLFFLKKSWIRDWESGIGIGPPSPSPRPRDKAQ